jgi:glycosyltransferase involved in cell wall biosynthesis
VRAIREGPISNVEIIIVDDYFTDGTRELLQQKPAQWVDKMVLQDRNQGKGAALRRGFALATGDFIIVQDADLKYDPKEYPLLLAPLIEDRGRRRIRLPFFKRPPSSRRLLLAHGGKSISHPFVKYVY